MAKKAKRVSKKTAKRSKKNQKYECKDCGLIVTVSDPCTCDDCDITCCGSPMVLI